MGAVGARLCYPDGRLQHGGVIIGLGGIAGHAHYRWPRDHPDYFNRAILQQDFSAVTVACMRKNVFEELGRLDEQDLGVSFNDMDFCRRMVQQGSRNCGRPQACLPHQESASGSQEYSEEQKRVFRQEVAWMKEKWRKTRA